MATCLQQSEADVSHLHQPLDPQPAQSDQDQLAVFGTESAKLWPALYKSPLREWLQTAAITKHRGLDRISSSTSPKYRQCRQDAHPLILLLAFWAIRSLPPPIDGPCSGRARDGRGFR
ncbi:hypothetical protein N7492_010011 [Penicillium capsulatum]|uniref:Uncharacterized protein n=1 Tax=Penicillium capsulatum TaxID=69766 RepID=A0A9W9LDH0_9EURO|nr:hypothetical protein N7492_010011 [Penicillium capsulatum]